MILLGFQGSVPFTGRTSTTRPSNTQGANSSCSRIGGATSEHWSACTGAGISQTPSTTSNQPSRPTPAQIPRQQSAKPQLSDTEFVQPGEVMQPGMADERR